MYNDINLAEATQLLLADFLQLRYMIWLCGGRISEQRVVGTSV